MNNRTLNIDTAELSAYTKKLQNMQKFDLPLAIRGALNDTAEDMKTQSLNNVFTREFTIRRKNFLKSVTAFNKCDNTFDVSAMKSEAGVFDKNESARRLFFQEFGGTLKNRAVPMSAARSGEDASKTIIPSNYYKKFMDLKKGIIKKTKSKVLIKSDNAIYQISKGGKWKVIYSLGRDVNLKAHPFVEVAGEWSALKLPFFYIKNAERRLLKYK